MTKTFTRLLVLLLIYFLGVPAFAQNMYKKGYYISSQQDTIWGYILDRNWSRNPEKVSFKATTETKEIKILTATAISEFGLEAGDQFVSEIVDIDKTSLQLQTLQNEAATNVVRDTVFLRVVNKGAASLLYLNDENSKEHFFYQKQQETPIELKFKKHIKEDGGKKVVITSEIYKGQLFTYLNDCPELKNVIPGLKYQLGDLQSVFRRFNECKGISNKDYTAKPQKIKAQFGLISGLSKTTLTFSGIGQETLTKPTFKSPISQTLGITLNLIFPRSHQKWIVHNELLWKPYTAKAEFTQITSADN